MSRNSPASLLRRYKWDDLTEPEREAISDAIGIGAIRAGVGVGAVLTVAALITSARRGKPPLPPVARYGGVGFFSLLGSYFGFLSAGPMYAQRILSVPNSRLADDLRIVMGDWQSRVPVQATDIEPHAPLPNPDGVSPNFEPEPLVRRGDVQRGDNGST